MSLLNKIFSLKESSKFLTEKDFKANLDKQLKMSPQTLEQLRQYNVTNSSRLKLEFFFYTDKLDNAIDLTNELKSKKYSVVHGPSADDPKILIISGWTLPIKMDIDSVLEWIKEMCEVGYEFDCDFDGWGTNPEQ
jgi:hypothetical protein